MPYTAEINRSNPSCFIFLIDQSGSMGDPFGTGESTRTKAEGLADAINRILQNLVIKCAKSEGVYDYFHVGVIGYGTHVTSAFSGPLSSRDLVPVSEIATSPSRIESRTKKVEDGAGGLVEQSVKFPVWFEPVANGGTPMCQAFSRAKTILEGWLKDHGSCFPPVIIHLTDGESTDGDPSALAMALRDLKVDDGNVLLFNVHLSSQRAMPITFADSEANLPDQYAKLLFSMSSHLPDYMRQLAHQSGFPVSENTRGFAFNADLSTVIQFLTIGTQPSNLR